MTGWGTHIPWDRLLPEFVRRNRLVKFGVVIALVVALIAAVGALTYVETVSELETNTRNDYTAMSEQGATELTAWQRERSSDLTVLATADVFDDPESTTEIRDYLSGEIGSTAPDTVAFHYLSRETDEILATTARGATEESMNAIPSVPSFDSADDVVVSDPYERDDEQMTAFFIPVSDSHALALESNIGILVDNAITPTSGSFVSVADETGETKVTNRPEASAVSYPELIPSDQQFGDRTGFASTVDLDSTDEEYLVAHTPVHGTDLTYVLHVPESEAYALSAQISRNMIVIIAIAVAGLGAIGVGIARPTINELDRLGDLAHELETGNLDVDLETDNVDEIGQLYASFASMRESLRRRINEAEQQRSAARTARAESEAFADRLETRASEFGERMERAAAGDLTVRLSAEPEDPEALHSIADGFNDALGELEAMVAEVDRFAADVAGATMDVTDSVDAVATAGTETSQSVGEIAAGADRQRTQLEAVASDMEDMSATIEEVAASADDVSETSRRAAELSERGQEATVDAVAELHRIETRSESAAQTVDRLEAEMTEVGRIVETISEIAEQTNILALNANIEATRAVDAGDGFGVVAEEVKTLASETQDSAAEIESLIETLRQRTDDCVAEMRSIRAGVSDGVETVEAAEDTLDRIAQQVEDADMGIREISEAMDTQANAVSTVSGAVDDVAAISRETTAEATDVVTTVDQQAETLDRVATHTDDLATQAETLTELIDNFTVSDQADASTESVSETDGSAPLELLDAEQPSVSLPSGNSTQ